MREQELCGKCNGKATHGDTAIQWIECDTCHVWIHPECYVLPADTGINWSEDIPFYCPPCLQEAEQESDQETQEPGPTNDQQQVSGPQNQELESTQEENFVRTCPFLSNITNQDTNTDSESEEDTSTDSDSNGATEDDGYAEIEEIKDHRIRRGKRQFLIKLKNSDEEWLDEKNLDGCVTLLKLYCRTASITRPRIQYKSKVGSSNTKTANTNNWVNIEDIIDKAKIYGNKQGLQPKQFQRIEEEDGLYIIQIGVHAFAALHFAKQSTIFIADGGNLASKCNKTKAIIQKLFEDVENGILQFNRQREEDQCGSSAAGIAIELQRLYPKGLS